MKLTRTERFAFRRWKKFKSEAYIENRSEITLKTEFLKKFRAKKDCCKNRVESDFFMFKNRPRMIKFSQKDQCAMSFTTHLMQRLIPRIFLRGPINDVTINTEENQFVSELKTLKDIKMRKNNNEFQVFKSDLKLNGLNAKFYKFNQKECECDVNYKLFRKELKTTQKYTSFLQPAMCNEFMRPYIMDKHSLNDLKIKDFIFKYFVPYVFVIPILKSISGSLIVRFLNVFNKKEKLCAEYISESLYNEFAKQEQHYKRNMAFSYEIPKFIISGGFLLYIFDQVTTFGDIDIYISDDEISCYEYFFRTAMDTTGKRIWYINKNVKYIPTNTAVIKYTISMNFESKFFKLLKEHLKTEFHPIQFVVYTRDSWSKCEKLNLNFLPQRERTQNMDKLFADAYNIMDMYDLPMCRNALMFLHSEYYYGELDWVKSHFFTRETCDRYDVKFNMFDQNYGEHIKEAFCENTLEEKTIVKKYYCELDKQYPICIAGIKYQSGVYRSKFHQEGVSANKNLDRKRWKKYIDTCTLNQNIEKKERRQIGKLNFNVPTLKFLAFQKCQMYNENIFLSCFCNPGEYYENCKINYDTGGNMVKSLMLYTTSF